MLRRIVHAASTALMLAVYHKAEERKDMSRDHCTDAELVANALHNIDDTLERTMLVLERIAVALEHGKPSTVEGVQSRPLESFALGADVLVPMRLVMHGASMTRIQTYDARAEFTLASTYHAYVDNHEDR